MGVGKKRQGGLGDAVNVINTLVPLEPEQLPQITETHWRAAALAGQAILELRLGADACRQPHCQAVVERMQRWLVQLVGGGHLPAKERAAAGDVLGRLGDPRPGAGVLVTATGRWPDMVWIEIPAGPFTMGSAPEDEQAYDDERPAHRLALPRYYIGRYPVTNAQYALFLADGGYLNPDFWTPEGWAWREGAEADLSGIDDPDFRRQYKEWLARRPAGRRDRPFWWDDPRWGAPTRPVVGVCWFEALAYCRWLQEQFRRSGHVLRVWKRQRVRPRTLRDGGYVVRLPSEAEWEKAARGSEGLRWPWGDRWQEGRVKHGRSRPERDLPGRHIPQWRQPLWRAGYGGQRLGVDAESLGQDVSGARLSVPLRTRGRPRGIDRSGPACGAWRVVDTIIRRYARCAVRIGYEPDYFDDVIGFRVVVSLSDSGS